MEIGGFGGDRCGGNDNSDLGGEIVTTESAEGRGEDEVEVAESDGRLEEAIDAMGGGDYDGVMGWGI